MKNETSLLVGESVYHDTLAAFERDASDGPGTGTVEAEMGITDDAPHVTLAMLESIVFAELQQLRSSQQMDIPADWGDGMIGWDLGLPTPISR
jgi:hypothetical protein